VSESENVFVCVRACVLVVCSKLVQVREVNTAVLFSCLHETALMCPCVCLCLCVSGGYYASLHSHTGIHSQSVCVRWLLCKLTHTGIHRHKLYTPWWFFCRESHESRILDLKFLSLVQITGS